MLAFRLSRVVLHLLEGLATCAFVFPWIGETQRETWIRRWSRRLLALCRVRVEVERAAGAQAVSRALIVANHVSWLDIFVINTLRPCRFVAKSDIRGWPLIGWLCAKTGTIFIARGKLRDVRHIYQGLVASLRAGARVAFFPEGTTAAQGRILPFHANLFEAAIEAQVPVQPYAVSYVDEHGSLHPAVDFIGDMSFAQSMCAILRGTPVIARLAVLPPIPLSATPHRRELADAAHHAIGTALHAGEAEAA
jgi:1-acyl-sn-glycerol-3-phosphate acyltransferase